VVAPHPFFPATVCLRADLERHADLFDAVERNAMFIRGVDFNRAAERFAARHGKPVVGNCDVHRLAQLGSTYSWWTPSAIGRVCGDCRRPGACRKPAALGGEPRESCRP
jgi:hypothetical protein